MSEHLQEATLICEGSYSRLFLVTERDEEGPVRGVCPICEKELSVNRATASLRAHRS